MGTAKAPGDMSDSIKATTVAEPVTDNIYDGSSTGEIPTQTIATKKSIKQMGLKPVISVSNLFSVVGIIV